MKDFPFKKEGWVHPVIITARTKDEANKQFKEFLKNKESVTA